MSENSGRYWFIGLLLTLGVWGGWLPTSRALAGSATAAKSESDSSEQPPEKKHDRSAEHSKHGESDSDSGSADAAGGSQSDAKATPAAQPCARGRELLNEYTAVYRPNVPLRREDYLLALVPDPKLIEHGASFEAVLEGIEEAAIADAAGVRDREWLPWRSAPDCVERAPGRLLFRPRDPSRDPPRVVLLVGETPTWGVRKQQLEAAIAEVQTAAGNAPLKVLGPTFSGSAASVIALLRPKVEAQELGFRFVSGTASSPQLPDAFRPIGGFEATVPNDTQLLDAMLAYLHPRGGKDEQIAILSEASTTYGSSVNRVARGSRRLIELRFPIDLAPLRNAVASAKPVDSADPASDPRADPEVLVLDEISRDLSRQRVRFVGVIATDPSDVILLTGRLRAKLPDVRFFTLGADVQFTNPQLASPLNGMLVAHAAAPAHSGDSVSMKNELVRGVYLAGRALLGAPLTPPRARISLIGNGALWELDGVQARQKTPISWRVVQVCTLILFALAILCVTWPSLTARHPALGKLVLARQHGPLALAVGHCEREDLRADDVLVTAAWLSAMAGAALLMLIAEFARRSHCLSVACAIGAPLVILACWSRALLHAFSGKLKKSRPSAIVCSLLGLLAAVLALGIGCAPPTEAGMNLMSGGSGVLAGLLGFAMVALGLWCWRVRLRFLDTHRFSQATRADHPPLAEALAEHPQKGTGFFDLEKQLLEVIHSPWAALPAVPIGVHALLLLSVLLVYGVRSPAAFEPGWRNDLVIGFGLISLLPITVNFSRIIATWVLLGRLLTRLAMLPMVEKLRKLPGELVRNLEQQLTVPHADLSELTRPVQVLGRIGATLEPLRKDAQRAQSVFRTALLHQTNVPALLASAPNSAKPTNPPSADAEREHGQLVDILLAASGRLHSGDDDVSVDDDELDELRNELLALLVAIFIPRYLRHFRLYVIPVLVGSVLGVLMTSLYFVQPQRLITSVIFVWVAGMVLVSFLIYSSLDRSAVISAIGNTTEGSVDFDWTLVTRVITWGIVPVLSLFAAQYPNFSNWVSLLVNGLGKALR